MGNTRTIGITALTVMMALTGWGINKIATTDGAVAAAAIRTACPSTGTTAGPSAANTPNPSTVSTPTPPTPSAAGATCAPAGTTTAGPSAAPSPNFTPGARDGLACSPEGAVIQGVNGTTFTCTKKSGRTQSLWVAKK